MRSAGGGSRYTRPRRQLTCHPFHTPRFHISASWRLTIFLVRRTILNMSTPRFPISGHQSFEFVSSLTLLPSTARGHLDIPSVRVFFTAGICFAIYLRH